MLRCRAPLHGARQSRTNTIGNDMLKSFFNRAFAICLVLLAEPAVAGDANKFNGSWQVSAGKAGSFALAITSKDALVCGHYSGESGSKVDFSNVVGSIVGDQIHLFFFNGYTGEMSDIGEADLMFEGRKLVWRLSNEPVGPYYVWPQAQMYRGTFVSAFGERQRLQRQCNFLDSTYSSINRENAEEVLKLFGDIVSSKILRSSRNARSF